MPALEKPSNTKGPQGVVLVGNDLSGSGVTGNNFIEGSNANDTLTGGNLSGPASLTNDIYGRAGDDNIVGGSSRIGGVHNNAYGGQGNDTITGGTPGFLGGAVNNLMGDSGNDFITGGDNGTKNYLYGDSGSDTLLGGSSSYLHTPVDNYIEGGSGDDMIIGGTSAVFGSVTNLMFGGSGKDTIVAGYNSIDINNIRFAINELSGGDDADMFVLKSSGFHKSSIMDFSKSEGDKIDVSDYHFESLDGLFRTAIEQNGGTLFRLDDVSTLFLAGTTIGSLAASNFLFDFA